MSDEIQRRKMEIRGLWICPETPKKEDRTHLPYPEWCRHPEQCRGLASCPDDPTCAD